MKKFIQLGTDNIVMFVNYQMEGLEQEVLDSGYIIDTDIPVAEDIVGKTSVLHFDPETETFSYTYKDRPLTQAEELNKLKDENAILKNAQAQIMLKLVRNNIK